MYCILGLSDPHLLCLFLSVWPDLPTYILGSGPFAHEQAYRAAVHYCLSLLFSRLQSWRFLLFCKTLDDFCKGGPINRLVFIFSTQMLVDRATGPELYDFTTNFQLSTSLPHPRLMPTSHFYSINTPYRTCPVRHSLSNFPRLLSLLWTPHLTALPFLAHVNVDHFVFRLVAAY